jgi:hypothetical protein
VRAPAGFGLYFRITVTNVAATLPSLLPGGVLPAIPVANVSGPAGLVYSLKFVDLQSETDPATIAVRYTDDGQTVPTSTLGFVVPGGASFVRIPCDVQDVKLISTGANVSVQVKLGILGVTTGGN